MKHRSPFLSLSLGPISIHTINRLLEAPVSEAATDQNTHRKCLETYEVDDVAHGCQEKTLADAVGKCEVRVVGVADVNATVER